MRRPRQPPTDLRPRRREVHERQNPGLLDLLSVASYVNALNRSATPLMAKALDAEPVVGTRPQVLERSQALPRAYVVHEIIQTDSRAAAGAAGREGATQ